MCEICLESEIFDEVLQNYLLRTMYVFAYILCVRFAFVRVLFALKMLDIRKHIKPVLSTLPLVALCPHTQPR